MTGVHRTLMAGLWVLGLGALPAAGQEPSAPETRKVVAGEQFGASGLHTLLFGANYRDLWTAPVVLPVLDLRSFDGGLTPVRRVGHGQTQALALRGATGKAWTFRPVVKDPVGLLPEELRESVAADFIRDQMSSQHPAGHVMVPPVMTAVGLIHNTPRLVVMPDDAALGEFREDFAGVVGDIEEYVGQEGYAGALDIVDGEEMWKKLDASPDDRVDARAFLRARFVDHLIGDWDRHLGQWNFARMPGEAERQPVTEDRDQAFVRFQGLVLAQVRAMLPMLMVYGPKYPDLEGLLFDSWDVDRRLLPGLSLEEWEEEAAFVQGRVTDAVIDEAVHAMPEEYVALEGERLKEGLEGRRDRLPEHARRYYRFLNRQVDVRGTDQPDRLEIAHHGDGTMDLRILAETGAEPWFQRTFHATQTEEVRVLLLGGDDEAVITGPDSKILVRVVTGPGNDTVDDSASGRARVYASDPGDKVRPGPHTHWSRKPYRPPPVKTMAEWIPPRDWGRRTLFPLIRINGSSDLGLVPTVGATTTGYGFRKLPWADQQTARLAYSTTIERIRADYTGRYRLEASPLVLGADAHFSGLEVIRFYGFGNDTPDADEDQTRVKQREILARPSLHLSLGERGTFSVGIPVKVSKTYTQGGSILDELSPYGTSTIGQVGVESFASYDSTDVAGLPTRGLRLNASGSFYPEVWDLEAPFGEVHGDVATWLSARTFPGSPTLSLRLGGKHVFGTYPYYEAAFLGGPTTVRGLDRQRYAGDAAVWANVELRVRLARFSSFAPVQVGLIGLYDVGRVFYDDEDSDTWHQGAGGGVFIASPQGRNALGFLVARSEGATRFYIRAGLAF